MSINIAKSCLEAVVDLQLKAYNAGDYKTFAKCYDLNILSYDFETSEQIPELCRIHFFNHYEKKFSENPNLHCQVVERIIHDNLVIDKEIVSNFQSKTIHELVIYQVDDGLITKMWFKKGTV
jgi:hypothetical protein